MKNATDDERLKATASPTDWRIEYRQRYYSGPEYVRHHWPNFVRKYLRPGARVLEIGGGPADWTTGILREQAAEIVGLDIDPVVQKNRLLDRALVYDGGTFPLPSGQFDLAVSRWVNEHLLNPNLHFREVARVLAPGGLYIFRTVNLCHYMAICSYFVPHWLQVPLVRWLNHVPAEFRDPYPTHYRVNTRRRIVSLSRKVGLIPTFIQMSEEYPSWGQAFKALFFVFMGYERLVNSSSRFEGFRHTIDCAVRKPELAADNSPL